MTHQACVNPLRPSPNLLCRSRICARATLSSRFLLWRSLGEAHVRRALSEFTARLPHLPAAVPSCGIPCRVKTHRTAERGGLRFSGWLFVDEGEGGFEVVIARPARDEQPHDLRRPLGDQ